MKKFLALLLAMVMVLAFVPTVNASSLGDVNGDGAINSRDIAAIQKDLVQIKALSSSAKAAADVNGDGSVNSRDMAAIQKHILRISIIGDEDLIKLEHGETVAVDLDVDGDAEYVTFYEGGWDNGEYKNSVIAIAENENADAKEYTHNDEILGYDAEAYYVAKLDNNSNKKTIIAASGYASVMWTSFSEYKNGILTEMLFYGGESFESVNSDRTFNLMSPCDCLGTRLILKKYQKNGENIIKVEEDIYNVAYLLEEDLTVKKEVPAVLIENGNEMKGYIPVGTEIFINALKSDLSKVYFKTADDSMNGYIEIELGEYGYNSKIAGISEDEYFEYVPYSG